MQFKILFIFALLFEFFTFQNSFGQDKSILSKQIDSLINAKTEKPFSGIIAITKHGKVQYSAIKGFANKEKKTPLERNDQFVIGSISKQFTAALTLRAYDEGNVSLHTPIKEYLPNLKLSWADTVTIHQLLTHTHGIVSLNKALSFRAGTQYAYSQIGYNLMVQILESVYNNTFAALTDELFKNVSCLTAFTQT